MWLHTLYIDWLIDWLWWRMYWWKLWVGNQKKKNFPNCFFCFFWLIDRRSGQKKIIDHHRLFRFFSMQISLSLANGILIIGFFSPFCHHHYELWIIIVYLFIHWWLVTYPFWLDQQLWSIIELYKALKLCTEQWEKKNMNFKEKKTTQGQKKTNIPCSKSNLATWNLFGGNSWCSPLLLSSSLTICCWPLFTLRLCGWLWFPVI